jgi:hypothetical protein
MTPHGILRTAIIVSLVVASSAALAALDPEWPREYQNDKGKLQMYQPQVTSWEDFERLEARLALAFAPTGSKSPALGTMVLTAKTDVNTDEHRVRVYDIAAKSGNFPTLTEDQSKRLMNGVLGLLPKETEVELERLVANLDRFESQPQQVELKVDPPKIFVSTTPAILVVLNGKPIMSPIKDNELKFAVNTNWDLFELAQTWYLRNEDAWYKALTLGGPWAPAGKLPKPFKILPKPKKDPTWKDVKENMPGKKIKPEDVPRVFLSEMPAELILIDAEPSYAEVPGTKLLWIDNTDSDLFLSTEPREYYYLVSGRWFKSVSLDGPWTFASLELPDDFQKFPAGHPRSRIRSSVPGTAEADQAVLLAQIPQKATIKRNGAKPDVHYSGEPEFKPIDGSSMTYAVNSPNDVIRVGDIYYCCFQGVWFASTSPTGPWEVADEVPGEIYTIPPSSPVYHTTHVKVYDSSPDYVVVGYTSGYSGVYVSYGTVWYGTGWYYPPYYYYGGHYPVYYHYPHSYGMSTYYNPHTGTYGRGYYGYGPYGGAGYGARYNPTTGTYARGAAAHGPYNAGGWAQAYNPRTGTSAGTYQRSTPYSQWGQSTVRRGDNWAHTGHYSDSRGTVAGFETSKGARGVGYSGEQGRGFAGKGADNNLYAGRDGNVYRHDDNGWAKHGENGWENTQNPRDGRQQSPDREAGRQTGTNREQPSGVDGRGSGDRTGSRGSMNQLERDRQARTQGASRAGQSQQWRSSGASRSGSRGSSGGARRGGGRRR